MSWGYDAWKLQSPEDAGFYRFDEDEEDDLKREQQLAIEGRAYLAQARDLCRNGLRSRAPNHALDDIAEARAALTEAALRFAEMKKIEDAQADDLPF